MSEYKMAPKYILLTAPTLKQSRSTHVHSINTKSFEVDYKNQLAKYSQIDEGKHITKKPSFCTKQLDSVRTQMTSCIQNTISQTKRNHVLKQLITILEQSNKEIEEKSKNEWKQCVEMERKKMSKEEYEIDQILQKYNEEVARINTLREMANSARTDRVVYSALFKKIEWEIKHYQNLYREMILKTEANKIAKSQKQTLVPQKFESVDEFQMKDQSIKPFYRYDQTLKHPLFVTELQKTSQKKTTKKGNTQRTNQTQKKLLGLIEQVQNKIDQIVKRVQCVNAEDALRWYNTVQNENTQLLKRIEEEQSKIGETQNQIERINQERRNSEVAEERHVKKLESIPSTRKLRTLKNIRGPELDEGSTSDYVLQLAKVAGINSKNRPLTDIVIELQQRLSRQQMIKGNVRSGSILQSGLDNILTKMERFDNCQKIFSKRQFQSEYMKQLSKQKKHLRMRK